MTFDNVYAEFGFDKDTIRSVIIKNKIKEDAEFSDLFKKLEEFHMDILIR